MDIEKFLERHRKEMYMTALAYTKNPELAEDVLQETCIRILTTRSLSDLPTLAWVKRIIRNVFLDKVIRWQDRRPKECSYEAIKVVNQNFDVEDNQVFIPDYDDSNDRLILKIYKYVETQSIVDQQIFHLRMQKIEFPIIARLLDIPENTCKTKFLRLKRRLCQNFKLKTSMSQT